MLVTANVFQPLIDVFESVLKFFHNSGGISWGWSIVLLTIAVRAVLIPLTFRQIKSMVRMQSLAPQMKEIQAKYKEDKQRQSEEMMKFYRENNVNPLGSCLPLVLQLPVFISLYYMLRESLRNDICPKVQAAYQATYAHAHHIAAAAAKGQTTACGTGPNSGGTHFLFINDLTAKATGVTLGILIVLYVGSQIGSTLVMSAASMDPNQRRLMMALPLVFVLFVIRFPAGLLVYWITTNLWTVAQQYLVKKRVGPTQAAAVAAAAEAGGGGSGAASSGASDDSGGSGGGLGARLRERMAQAQSEAGSQRAAKGGNGASSGSSSASAPSSSSSSSSRTANRSTATKQSAPAKTRASKSRSGGGGRGGNGNGNGDGSGANGKGTAGAAGATPPRPPRKKKKRSGRRR